VGTLLARAQQDQEAEPHLKHGNQVKAAEKSILAALDVLPKASTKLAKLVRAETLEAKRAMQADGPLDARQTDTKALGHQRKACNGF
jgi:hypothetical protein